MNGSRSDTHLYFIAVIPPEPLATELNRLKKYLAEEYHSKASLNSPPHITLHMPFRWREKKLEMLFSGLEELAAAFSAFPVKLKNFGAFAPRVIFVDVAADDALDNLQKKVVEVARKNWKLDNANYKDRGFHPHITLAFRDLRKPMFNAAWTEFSNRSFCRDFQADGFYLMKHNGDRWQEHRYFEFAKQL
ncbi:MAG: 2'-5' RNA ligase family protein [Owenweeksia sp.]